MWCGDSGYYIEPKQGEIKKDKCNKVYLVYICWEDSDGYPVNDLDVIFKKKKDAKEHIKELERVNKGTNFTYYIDKVKVH